MNNKGFTLIELVATLVILGLVASLGLYSMNFNMNKAKEKTEEVFVDSLRDAIDVYLSSEFKNLQYEYEKKDDGTKEKKPCNGKLNKKHNDEVRVYEYFDEYKILDDGSIKKEKVRFSDIINSSYNPLTESEFVNPANEDVTCDVDAEITIYRDEDFVYYYSIYKRDLDCLLNHSDDAGNKKVKEEKSDGTKIYYDDFITNLPEGYDCD